jgi:tRNA(Ile)-lysidine synthase
MHDFERKLVTEWRRLDLPPTGKVVVAVSGGADSVALLTALDRLVKDGKLDVELTAAHFNHKLREEESEADEEFVRRLCAASDVALAVGEMQGSKTGNLEQNARDARYDFLQTVAENLNALAIVTAHTLNDQAETFLQNLIRGSGMTGLGAMSPVRTFHSPSTADSLLLVRPLLSWCPREETEAYCSDRDIGFRYDSMNDDLRFNRVRIRKVILPILKDLNPQIVSALSRTAELIRERVQDGGVGLEMPANPRVSELRKMGDGELRSFVRAWLSSVRGGLRGISSTHIHAVANLVLSQKSGRIAELPGKSRVIKSRGRLIYEPGMV